jgi:hypothetical protein
MINRSDVVPSILSRIANLETLLYELKWSVNNLLIPQSDRISELESMANPYSESGRAIGDYCTEDDYEQ